MACLANMRSLSTILSTRPHALVSACLLRTSAKLQDESTVKASSSPSCEANPNYVNRNPRNLEWSGHQYKRFGWNLQYPPKDFYNQCTFTKNDDSLEASIEHHTEGVVVKVSTDDLSIRQHLFSGRDQSAAINLAHVLVERCRRAGIDQFIYLKSNTYDKSQKEQAFYKTLVESGINLEEPEFVEYFDPTPGLDYDAKNFHHEKRIVPFPPIQNKLKREALKKLQIGEKA